MALSLSKSLLQAEGLHQSCKSLVYIPGLMAEVVGNVVVEEREKVMGEVMEKGVVTEGNI